MKHRVFRFAVYCLVAVSVLICALTGLSRLLPGYTNSVLLPAIASDLGVLRFTCGVRRIGLTGADLGPAAIGDDKNTALSVGAVQVDYTLTELFDHHLRRVSISGLDLECGIEKGKLVFPGFDPQVFFSKIGDTEKSPPSEKTFSFGQIEIRNATLACRWNGRVFLIPFHIEVTPTGSRDRELRFVVRLFPRGQKIECTVDADLDGKTAVANLMAEKVLLDAFADLTGLVPGLAVSGQADLSGDVAFRFDPFSVSHFGSSLRFRNKASRYGDVSLAKYEKAGGPARIDVAYDGMAGWEISGGLALDSPFPVGIPEFACRADLSNGFEASGNLTLFLKHGKKSVLPLWMTEPLELKERFSVEISPAGEWACQISDSEPNPGEFGIGADGFRVSANTPKIEVTGKGDGSKGNLKIGMALSQIRGVADDTRIGIPALSFKAESAFEGPPSGFPKTVAFRFDAPDMTVETGGIFVKAPEMSVSGVVKKGETAPFRFDGFLKLAQAEVGSAVSYFLVDGINGTIPLKWPCDDTGAEGRVSVARIRVGEKRLGSIQGAVRQTPAGIEYDAVHDSRFIPGAVLKLSGRSETTDKGDFTTEIDFGAMPMDIVSGMDLGRFFQSGKGVTVTGKPSAEGRYSYRGSSRCSLDFTVENGGIRTSDETISFQGVRGGIRFTDLFDLKSAPKQTIGFDRASVGDILLEKGRFDFQLESGGGFFVETGRFNWCNGSVFSQATRIRPGSDDVDLVLYCDRLNLALLLAQLGVGNVRGKGTVSGRIPIRYVDGKLSFDDGFLFSTPGDGGSIHVTGMEHLTAGIPEGTLQYAQIELAREALKDFEYKWAKLRMVSKGDDLELRLGFDGKPAHPLPFTFDEKLGGFTKMRAGGQKSDFQGIQLDVNVRLPLNDVLQYKDFLKFIQ